MFSFLNKKKSTPKQEQYPEAFSNYTLQLFSAKQLDFMFSTNLVTKNKINEHILLDFISCPSAIPFLFEGLNKELTSIKQQKYHDIVDQLFNYMLNYKQCELVFNAYMQMELADNEYCFFDLKFIGINLHKKLALSLVNIREVDFYEFSELKVKAKKDQLSDFYTGVFKITTKN